MRGFYLAIAFGALGLGAFAFFSFSPAARADSDVLLPSDNAPADAPADLGLQPPGDNKSISTPSPQPASGDTSALPVIDPANEPPPVGGFSTPVAQTNGNMPATKLGTQVIKLPVVEQATTSLPAGSTSSSSGRDLTIDIDKNSKLGDGDLGGIKRTLGYSTADAQKHCHISINGMIVTDKTSVPYQMSPHLMHTVVHLDGKPSSIVMIGAAICDMLPVPENLGVIMQVDDKYSVPLQFMNCQPPTETAQRFEVNYSGDGKAQCSSQ